MTPLDLVRFGFGLIFTGLGVMILISAAAMAVLLWNLVCDA